MFLSDFSIRKPIVTVVVVLALVTFGLFSFFLLQTDEFPRIEPPVVSVSLPYPGASPETVETEVVNSIEEAIAGISGVDTIQSTALDGYAVVIVEFVFGKDPQQATQDIRDEISRIRNDLPTEMEEPVLQRFDPNEAPIVSLTLTSDTKGPAELTRIADPGITRDLRSIAGVAEVRAVGGLERQIVVQIRPADMAAAGIGMAAVIQALQQQNLAAPVGRVIDEFQESSIRLQGRLQNPREFEQIIVKHAGGSVRLGQIADVVDATEEERTAALYNESDAVGIDIVKSAGSSTTAVAEDVLARVEEIQKTLPEDVSLRVVRNSGERVAASVLDVELALLEGAALTVIVVFLFLNSWRSTVITGLTLPVSVIASFIAVEAFDFTLNTMSLLGLSLAIGILIDDAIVVRENIVRHVRMGKDHLKAAHEGTDEIGMAVTATTLSIVVVFVPVAFMGGLAQQWFAPFALTIAASVMVSLLVSFSFDPMLSAYWPDPEIPDEEKGWLTRRLDAFNAWFEHQADRYASLIGWALRHRLAAILSTVLIFAAAMALPVLGIVGGAFFPDTDDSEFSVRIETPPGSNLDYTRAKAQEVARMARELPEVDYTYTTIGGETGEVDEGNIFVRMTPKTERGRSEQEVSAILRERVQPLLGVTVSILNGNMAQQKQVQVEIKGPDEAILNRLAEKIRGEVEQIRGAVDVGLSTKGRKPELVVDVDRGLASSLGISLADIAMSLRPAFAGIDVGDWVDPTGETRDVYIRLAREARSTVADLLTLPLTAAAGGQASSQENGATSTIPLGQVADVEKAMGPAQIDHLDRQRVIRVQANTDDRPLSEVMGDIRKRVDRIDKPSGYEITYGGDVESQQEVFGRIFTALGVALLLMYFVLVVQFGSFLDPLSILLSLPLSLIGVMLALLVTGSTLNLMSLIGVILLMGIVAKNAILLIDFAKWSEEEGEQREKAIVEAGRVRLRPILMTSFALIAGMLPVASGIGEGADFRAPMGQAIIGGVITSTLLTLLVIPTVYDIFAGWRDRAREWFGSKTSEPAAAHGEGQG